MKTVPVKRYGEPRYPIRAVVDEHPELLRLMPRRWQGNALVTTALAACLTLSSCKATTEGRDISTHLIAPIFEHGEGRGSLGCVAVNPPVFLSEDEARQVVMEEAAKAKIKFLADSRIIRDVETPITTTQPHLQDGKPKAATQHLDLTLDGEARGRFVAYEYVSEGDYLAWEEVGLTSTLSTYDLKGAAEALRKGLAKSTERGQYAVFYDPMVKWDDVRKLDEAKYERMGFKTLKQGAKELALEELRKQVKDFIEWLKAQGVI